MRGDVRFNATCLIGNWNEDRELQRTVLKDFLFKRETGSLKIDKFQARMSTALAEQELSKIRDDPYVHFGDVIQLVHVDTGTVLSSDVEDKDLRPGELSCAATAAPELRLPCARNTFLLAKYRPPRMAALETFYEDDVLRYGQKVRLVANPAAQAEPIDSAGGPRPLCLFSRPISTTHFAKYSRSQYCGFTWRHTYDSVWQVVTPDPNERLVSQGVEVMAGAPVLFIHCATKKPLCLEPYKYPNDFGHELEVSVRQAASQGLKLANEQAQTGVFKGFIPKGENSDNFWTILTGPAINTLPEPQSNAMLVADVLTAMCDDLSKGTLGVQGVQKKIITLEDKEHEMKRDEFAMILHQCGVPISDADVSLLAVHYAADKAGYIYTRPFLTALKEIDANR